MFAFKRWTLFSVAFTGECPGSHCLLHKPPAALIHCVSVMRLQAHAAKQLDVSLIVSQTRWRPASPGEAPFYGKSHWQLKVYRNAFDYRVSIDRAAGGGTRSAGVISLISLYQLRSGVPVTHSVPQEVLGYTTDESRLVEYLNKMPFEVLFSTLPTPLLQFFVFKVELRF